MSSSIAGLTHQGLPAVVGGSEAPAHVEGRTSEAVFGTGSPSITMAAIYVAAVADGREPVGTPGLWINSSSWLRSSTTPSSFITSIPDQVGHAPQGRAR